MELERIGSQDPMINEWLLKHVSFHDDAISGTEKKNVQAKMEEIRKCIDAQILYLPTYRRIERELSGIFLGVDADDLMRHRNRFRQSETSGAFIELVEFGMKDVQRAVDRTLDGLKEFARDQLNNLTVGYLGDVVNQEYLKIGIKEINDASEEEKVRAVLGRISESILTKDHKEYLLNVITSAPNATAPTEHQQIIYHYLLKLLGFQQIIQQKEQQIATFCDLCSVYLIDKSFVYDSPTFSVSIQTKEKQNEGRSIMLGDLSSGEKQIVSLFSHLYLSGQDSFFVLIDEPELSLSVPWQRRFLKDIRSGQFCKGLVAVTHSPFIYDNDLCAYTHSIGEFAGI